MPTLLPDGVYESLVTQALERAIDEVQQGGRSVQLDDLKAVEGTALLVRHLATELGRRLGELARGGPARPLQPGAHFHRSRRARVAARCWRGPAGPARSLSRRLAPASPQAPLSLSGLLTGAEGEPRLGTELEAEIATADRIDALVSFVTWEGWRRMSDAFQRFSADKRPLRLMTTTYTGATEAEAVEALARLPGAQVRISFDGRRTRLHAKAWLFHRLSGFSTAYVGSANLSRAALSGGIEWTVKAGQADLPHVLEKFSGTFESLWECGEFEPFDPESETDRRRLREALDHESGRKRSAERPRCSSSPSPRTRSSRRCSTSSRRSARCTVVAATWSWPPPAPARPCWRPSTTSASSRRRASAAPALRRSSRGAAAAGASDLPARPARPLLR